MSDQLSRDNVRDKIKTVTDQFLDGRAEKVFRAQVDLMNLLADISHLRYQTEVDISRLECEERRLWCEVTDRYVGGTGKEREAKAFLDEAFVKKKQELDEAVAFSRYLSKSLDQLSQLEEAIRLKSVHLTEKVRAAR